MICPSCGKGELIHGTLEGVSFEPTSEGKKLFSSGVYGIEADACPVCGQMTGFKLDAKTLRKIAEKGHGN